MNLEEIKKEWKLHGDWIQTFSGRKVYPLALTVEQINIFDIANALSMLCRFGGHIHTFYSVAEHSVRVSRIGDQSNALWKLLHDATEAYLVDLPRPIKRSRYFGELYRLAESEAEIIIAEKFTLPLPMPKEVKECDEILLLTEQRDLLGPQIEPWQIKVKPLEETIVPLAPAEARDAFLFRYEEIIRREE